MKTNVKMNCPNCGSTINVDELLVSQFEQSIKKDLEAELLRREHELVCEKSEFKKLTQEFAAEKENAEELINSRVKAQLLAKEDVLKDAIRKEIDDEKSKQLQELENELIRKSSQLKELNGTKTQLERLRREIEEKETQIIFEKEKELNVRLEEARVSIKEQVQQETFLKLKEREKVIDDLKNKLDEAKRKAEQGSMQLQGEIQELVLEETLRTIHPTDEIIEVKKGELGADCIQVVRTNTGTELGKILYESKNTKSFSEGWLDKLKQDNLVAKADIMVIVTAVMPKDITGKFGIKNGIWICSPNAVQDLSLALRFGLLKLQSVAVAQYGKESKMELLYNYLTSNEFKSIFEAILDGFKKIQDSHNDEKKKMQRLWAERQKVLEQTLSNAIEFYGSIKGIAGAAILDIPMLTESKKAA